MDYTIRVCDLCGKKHTPAVDSLCVISATHGKVNIDVCGRHRRRFISFNGSRRSAKKRRQHRSPTQVKALRKRVAKLSKAGYGQSMIASRLHITPALVGYHIKRIRINEASK